MCPSDNLVEDDDDESLMLCKDDDDIEYAHDAAYFEMDRGKNLKHLMSSVPSLANARDLPGYRSMSQLVRKPNMSSIGNMKGSIIENEVSRRFRKSRKHKDDYVMFDFEEKNENVKPYVEMGSKKWHFLDFGKKAKS